MSDELVQRLREYSMDRCLQSQEREDNAEAAAEIERLRAEVGGAEWELARQMNADFNRIRNQRTTIGQLKSQVAKLTGELTEWRETWMDESGTTWVRPTAWAYAQACFVLNKTKDELAALRKRVEEAPTGYWTYIGDGEEGDYGIATDDYNAIHQFEGKRVALVLLEE